MSLKTLEDVSYFKLNNEINIPVNNSIPLGKDKEAIVAFFKENVAPNRFTAASYMEKLEALISEDYLEEAFIRNYSPEFIEGLHQKLVDFGFHFDSFMAAYKFYNQYAMKNNDGSLYLEDFEDRVLMNALYQADGDEKLATALAFAMINRRYQPATPTFLNAGRKRRGEFVSCFLLQLTDDMNSIGRTINSALQLSKNGGGVGLNLSNLRAAGAPIKGYDGVAAGVVPVMKLFEDSFSYANQLGQRQGAGVVYLSIFHPDVMQFLSTKKENADEKIRVKTLSLGLNVPDKFYELVAKGEDMYLFEPYFVEKKYGIPFAEVDITAEYDNLLADDEIRKTKISARELEQEISKLQQESGYPYIINTDIANRANPVAGRISMSNLCTEILQVQTPSVLNDDQTYAQVGTDVACNLGSTNIINMMTAGSEFGPSIEAMVRALTYISLTSNLDTVPTVRKGNSEMRAIGLGAMGLHSYLAMNHIHYDSKEAVEFTSVYFMLLNYYTLKASNKLAVERGESFKGFEDSEYASGVYFDKYLKHDFFAAVSDKIKGLFDGIEVPSLEDWAQLKSEVQTGGLYNSYRLAVAPNGSISYINDCSSSIHPIVNRIEERQEKKVGKIYYPAAGLSTDTIPYYKSAYDTDMRKVIDVYAAATEHVDQGLSMTLFMRSTMPDDLYEWKLTTNKMTTRDLSILRNYAFNKGIKSIYYVRTFTDDAAEVGANQCESCVI
ncbi:class 1b ribonucleoside-diphosphate reductase subunit alpha [Lactococcus termiticola]|uniref:Ribonucleoside-diphosphate reductase n=1 Tax=Lactococcus termiticola TaxID=2169526 RepID=A0A2R5HI59_9LACT|nr:class 1b ribonucleoside-diphosphate reductase subunit alpha [Lactococcus termiticola]GBG97175.1 ribonucleoside-diphosphate reductase subunit alpha [Lactococcus termiticola]